MGNISINIAKDFTITPGPRLVDEGEHSAELFLKNILRSAFTSVLQSNSSLTIILDGTSGYATSFLEESFGGLQRENPDVNILDYLAFVSEEEPYLVDEIKYFINNA